MKKIYIFGTGGFAKEVYFLICEINKEKKIYEVAGFIGIESSVKQVEIGEHKFEVVEELSFFENLTETNVSFAIGIGSPKILKKIQDKYLSLYDFPNLIHPGVIGLFETIEMGKGNIITAGCIFTLDIKLGSFNIFNLHSTIGHDSVIGSCNVINPGTKLSGGLHIGNGNLIGTNAAILQYLNIHDNTVIGAGTIVRSDVESNQTIIGNPAVIGVKFAKLRNFINKL